MTGNAFGNKMQEEFKAWMERQRLVHRVVSTTAEARSPRSVDRLDVPSSRWEPSLPAIVMLPLAIGFGATLVAMGVAGPSNNRQQASRQEANDRLMVEIF